MSEEKMRAEFEAWAAGTEKFTEGDIAYGTREVKSALEIWQAATASKQQEIDALNQQVLELSAQVEAMREALEKIATPEKLQSHGDPVVLRICAKDALLRTIEPSAALRAHDNEVAAKALEEAANTLDKREEFLYCVEYLLKAATERRNRK